MAGLEGLHTLRVGYAVVFGVAALACFLSVFRAEGIDDDAIRRGLVGLLVTGGLWASAHVGRVLAPFRTLKVTFYLLGLIVGFGSVLAWLYFCSAYTGRPYHRTPFYRRLALLVWAAVVAVKLTNPLHNAYFTTQFVTTPFPHLVIQQLPLHWVVTGLAYALSAVGFYMLFELLTDIKYDTTVLGFLFLLTGAPVVFDIVGYVRSDIIIELNYEPLGVALFAVGVLYVTETTFLAVPRLGRHQLIDRLDEAILFLDDDDRLLDTNDTAREVFPEIQSRVDRPVGEAIPALSDPVAADGDVITVEQADATDPMPSYYFVNVTPLTAGKTLLGRVVVLTDVTTVERQRQELRRQNEQMDGFAAAVAHELRNALGVVSGNLEIIADAIRAGETTTATDRIEMIQERTDRMTQVVGDLTRLARLSQTVEDPPTVEFEPVVRTAWQEGGASAGDIDCLVEGDGTIAADKARLAELFQNVGQIAKRTNAMRIRVGLSGQTMTIRMDGDGVDADDPDAVFEYGTAVPDAQTGMLFANVQALTRAHGWEAELTDDTGDGLQITITGVETPSAEGRV